MASPVSITFSVLSGSAVLLCGAALGGLYWQGNLFDKQFSEASAQAAQSLKGSGFGIRGEELARGLRYRDIAIYVKTDGNEYRWTGRVDFGLHPTATLSLDKKWGAARALAGRVTGFSDRLTLTTDYAGRNAHFRWRVSPFIAKTADGYECSVGESTLEGPIASAANLSLTTGALRCKAGKNWFRIGTGHTGIKFDRKAQSADISTSVDGMLVKDNGTSVDIRRIFFSSAGQPSEKNSDPKKIRFVDASWALSLEDIQSGANHTDRFAFGMRFTNLSEKFALKLAAFSVFADSDTVLDLLVDSIKKDGLIVEVPELSVTRNGGTASFSGKLGIEKNDFGRFSVNVNPVTFSDISELRDAVAVVTGLGHLTSQDGVLRADIVLKENGLFVNGKEIPLF